VPGGVGGSLGGRLIESGADGTFLVREGRRKVLPEQGLQIESPFGDAQLAVETVVGSTALVWPKALRIKKGELWVERESAALPLRPLAPDTRQPTDNRASGLRWTPLTPSSGDTTYPVPSIPVPSIQVTAQE